MAANPSPEFQDWELLANSDSDAVDSPYPGDHLEETAADSDGVLRLDHFSLDNDNRFAKPNSEEASVESGNPSLVDFGSDRSAEHQLRDSDVSVADNEKSGIDLSGNGEGEFNSCDITFGNVEGEIETGFDETVKDFEQSGGEVLALSDAEKMSEDAVVLAEEANSSAVTVGERGGGCDEEKRKVVWWKVPFQLLKYCAFRMSPVWTFSMAAAVMGFVILGQRLYKMKRKARTLQLKVTLDDKKLASRAARLNEAFSAVRRVPVVRPLLPAVNSWPAINLR